MGNSTSGEGSESYYEEDEDEYAKQFDGIDTLGYRVLGVQPDSPASKAGLVSFFDFIVGANHRMLLGSGEHLDEGEEYDDVDFPNLLRESIRKPVLLLVYNIKARDQRVVELVPKDDWGGAGLLGVTIKLDDYGGADERLVRVLEVDDVENSPAKLAGLVPKEDFLLGTTATTLTNTDVLASLLHHHLGGVVELYVYSSKTDLVRVVGLHPTYSWGHRESMLGAAVGTGYLHRLPESCRSTIGKSVERTVSIVPNRAGDGTVGGGGDGEEPSVVQMEGTLEMETSEGGMDGDVGLAARGVQVQPHSLGTAELSTPQPSVRKKDPPSPAAAANDDDSRSDPPPPATIEPGPTVGDAPAASSSSTPVRTTAETPSPPRPQPEPPNEATELFAQPPPDFPEAAAAPVVSSPPPPPPPPPPQISEPEASPWSPPQPPPPPPPPQVPDPPTSAEEAEDDHDEEGSEYTDDDEEGSEYTDDEGEYTDDEEPEERPKRGFFGFMAPPPKMTY